VSTNEDEFDCPQTPLPENPLYSEPLLTRLDGSAFLNVVSAAYEFA
jgi:hypothetical protein